MTLAPGPDWVEMKAEVWPAHVVAPDGCHYEVNEEGRVWVRPYHVADFVQHRLQPMTVAHPAVAEVVADAISHRHHDAHGRIAQAALRARKSLPVPAQA